MVQAILTVTKGPGSGTRLTIRSGQVVRIGRTAWADISMPSDAEMSDVHFSLDYRAEGCRVRNLSGDAGTLVNGQEISESLLHTGDEISAGQSVFSVLVNGESKSLLSDMAAKSHADTRASAALQSAPPLTAANYVQNIELDEDAAALLQEQQTPEEFLSVLTDAECFSDAIQFLAIWLPKPRAVAWTVQCLRDTLGDTLSALEETAVKAAESWAAEPNEERRQAAGVAGEAIGYEQAAGMLALATFASGGSLAAPDLAPVPPPEGLTAKVIFGALTLAVYHGEPGAAETRYQEFIAAGKKLAAPSGVA